MSDVAYVPDTSPPPASSPTPAPSNEAVINPSPTSSPQPIGSQAPQKPISERPIEDSVQRAFDRAKDPNRPKPTPREAKMGDNNPPEETKREKFDLK
jgi:hypothetical protein